MSTDLTPFDFDGQAVRVALGPDGAPLFVLADICRVLDLGNPSMVATRLEQDDLSTTEVIDSMGRRQIARAVTESGVIDVTLDSRKPEARRFRRWLTHDVVPQIMKTGTYSAAPTLTDAEIVHKALQITSRQVDALTAQVIELTPRAAVADHLLNASGDMEVGDAAKALARSGAAIGRTRLFSLLDSLRWTYRSGGVRHVSQRAIEAGYLAALPKSHYHPKTGELVVDPPQVRVTPKGVARLLTHLLPAEEAS